MAFLLIRAAKAGYQAHKDVNSPTGPELQYDRQGRVKGHGPVYGLVHGAEKAWKDRQNKEHAEAGGEPEPSGAAVAPHTPNQSGHADNSRPEEDRAPSYAHGSTSMHEYRDEKSARGYDDKAVEAHDAPPTYETAVSPQPQARGPVAGFGNAATSNAAAQGAQGAHVGPASGATFRQGHAARADNRQRASSSSSSSSDSELEQLQLPRGMTLEQYRAAEREYKANRRQFKREQKALKRADKDEYRRQKKLMKAQRRSALFGGAGAGAGVTY